MTPSIKQRIEQIQCGEVPEGYSMERAMLYPNDWGTPVRLNTILWENKTRNEDMCYDKKDVLSVSGEQGIVNQIELMGRSYAGESVAPYHVVETSDIVYTKSPLKDNPYGIIKQNKGKPGIVSTLYAVYHCKNPIIGQYIENYFSIDTNLNNYLKPLVKRGAKNDMKVNNEDVLLGRIPLPRIEEQQRINVVIAHIDHIIELKQKLIDELKKLKKVCLEKMFPQKGNSVPEIRFPGFTAPWKQCELGEISSIKTGPFGTQLSAKEYVPYGRPVINVKNIGTGYVIEKDLDCISEQTALRLKDHILFENDVVFGRKGAIDRHAFIKREQNGWLQGSDCIRVRVSPGFLGSYFNAYLQTTIANTYLSTKAHGSTMSTLTTNMISSLPVWLPELAEQKHIAKTISCIDDCITFHQRELEAEQQKKKALMQLLLTGIVRV